MRWERYPRAALQGRKVLLMDKKVVQGFQENKLKKMLLDRDPPLEKEEQKAIRFALQIISEYKQLLRKTHG